MRSESRQATGLGEGLTMRVVMVGEGVLRSSLLCITCRGQTHITQELFLTYHTHTQQMSHAVPGPGC